MKAFTDEYFHILGDIHDRVMRPVTLTRYDGKTFRGVIDGVVVDMRKATVYKTENRVKFTAAELKELEGL